jgi:hypothetical protein
VNGEKNKYFLPLSFSFPQTIDIFFFHTAKAIEKNDQKNAISLFINRFHLTTKFKSHENIPFCLYMHHMCLKGTKSTCTKHKPMKQLIPSKFGTNLWSL